ncbi:MAG: hypothetical protein V4485_04925 [Pseudomonadota bacterium]
MSELVDLINKQKVDELKKELLKDTTIDILQEGGTLIKQAIKSGNIETIHLLFEHFQDYQLSQYDERDQKAVILRGKMRAAIELTLDRISTEQLEKLRPILSTYYDFDDTDGDNELDDDDSTASVQQEVHGVISVLQHSNGHEQQDQELIDTTHILGADNVVVIVY